MKNIKLKVCGMRDTANILQVASLNPDYLGFIFYPDSPRNFAGEIPMISPEIKKTGVFVNASLEFILEKILKYGFSAIQLHGEESPAFCRALREELPDKKVELIKVFSIKDEFDFQLLESYQGVIDFFLFDTKGKNKGGNGYVFNWNILKNYPSKVPFFLSGGIGLEEASKIEEFRRYLRDKQKDGLLYGIDVNSKFETLPGIKNIAALENFKNTI